MSFITPQPDTPPTSAPDSYPLGGLIHAALQSKEYLGQSGTGAKVWQSNSADMSQSEQTGTFDTQMIHDDFSGLCRYHHQSDAGRPRGWRGRINSDSHISGAAHHGNRFFLVCWSERTKEHHVVTAHGGRNNHHTDHHHHNNNHARARYLRTRFPWMQIVSGSKLFCCWSGLCFNLWHQKTRILMSVAVSAIYKKWQLSSWNCCFIGLSLKVQWQEKKGDKK